MIIFFFLEIHPEENILEALKFLWLLQNKAHHLFYVCPLTKAMRIGVVSKVRTVLSILLRSC